MQVNKRVRRKAKKGTYKKNSTFPNAFSLPLPSNVNFKDHACPLEATDVTLGKLPSTQYFHNQKVKNLDKLKAFILSES